MELILGGGLPDLFLPRFAPAGGLVAPEPRLLAGPGGDGPVLGGADVDGPVPGGWFHLGGLVPGPLVTGVSAVGTPTPLGSVGTKEQVCGVSEAEAVPPTTWARVLLGGRPGGPTAFGWDGGLEEGCERVLGGVIAGPAMVSRDG